MNRVVQLILIAGIALVAGIGIAVWTNKTDAPEIDPGAQVGEYRPDFRHGDLNGNWITPDDFKGKVLLVNFWATWCAPCRREMPLLDGIHREHEDVVVVGIAVDAAGPVRDYVENLGIAYPILVGASDVRATHAAWGNPEGMLPYTVVVDRKGVIGWRHLGEVTADEIRPVLEDLR